LPGRAGPPGEFLDHPAGNGRREQRVSAGDDAGGGDKLIRR
jgi:hypothetical protein